MTEKPPYRIPSMPEIAAVADNGLTVASTFSGCGGSCLGFRMDGYRVAYASEFVPAAVDTYRANYPEVPLDERDIREVTGDSIRELSGVDDFDVVEGSPPCASFSMAGKRSSGWNEVRKYSDVEQRVDDLFFEFARLVGELRPRAFVAENVAGLARGVAKGYFKQIYARLVEQGYRVEARLVDAQWLGVPQARRRIIFVGIRNDLDRDPIFPAPLPYRYSIRDALPDLDAVDVGADSGFGTETWRTLDEPAGTLGASPQTGNGRCSAAVIRVRDADGLAKRFFTIAELRRLAGFPDDFQVTGTAAQQWERLGRAVPPPVMHAVAASLRERVLS